MWNVFIFMLICGGTVVLPDDDATYLKRTASAWAGDLTHGEVKVRRAAAFALSKLGRHAVPELKHLEAALLKENDVPVRIAFATCLGELGPLASNDVLRVLVAAWKRESQPAVKSALATALGRLGVAAHSTEPLLVAALDDKHEGLRQQAVWALGQLGRLSEPTLLKLITLASATETSVRRELMTTLGNMGPAAAEAMPVLLSGLSDQDTSVQEQSILALRRLGPVAVKSIAPLLTVAENTKAEAGLRQAALLTLEAVWPTGHEDPLAWKRLQTLAQVAIPDAVRTSALQAQKKISGVSSGRP
jgi:HEAT repeat protein